MSQLMDLKRKLHFFIIQWKTVNLLQQASGIINFGTLEHYSAHLRPSRDLQNTDLILLDFLDVTSVFYRS